MDFNAMFATPESVAAQVLGLCAMLLGFVMYAFHHRGKILLAKLTADALWVVHYLLLDAASGAMINAVNVVREGVFYHKEKRWASHLLWPFAFLALNLFMTALSWQGMISLLPAVGSSLNVFGLWCSDPRRLRLVSLPALTAWMIYSVLVGSVWSLAVNAASVSSILFALIRDAKAKNSL